MTPLQIRQLIRSGHIKTFEDLISYTSVAFIAKAINRSPKHIETIRKDYSKLTLGDWHGLSEWIGMDRWRVVELFPE